MRMGIAKLLSWVWEWLDENGREWKLHISYFPPTDSWSSNTVNRLLFLRSNLSWSVIRCVTLDVHEILLACASSISWILCRTFFVSSSTVVWLAWVSAFIKRVISCAANKLCKFCVVLRQFGIQLCRTLIQLLCSPVEQTTNSLLTGSSQWLQASVLIKDSILGII